MLNELVAAVAAAKGEPEPPVAPVVDLASRRVVVDSPVPVSTDEQTSDPTDQPEEPAEAEEPKPAPPEVVVEDLGPGGLAVSLPRDVLKHALLNLGRVISRKSALPILQGIKVTVQPGLVTLEATDLDFYAQVQLVGADTTSGQAVLPARAWKELVGSRKTAVSTLKVQNGEAEIDGTTRLRTFDLSGYPTTEDFWRVGARDFRFGAKVLDAAIATSIAASDDDVRPILTGVYVDVNDGKLRWVATDSYRLAVADTDLPVKGGAFGNVPAKLFKLWKQLWGSKALREAEQTFLFGEQYAMLHRGTWSVAARLIEGTYPGYRTLIPPTGYPNVLRIDSEQALRALRVLSVVAEDHIPVRLELDDQPGVLMRVTRQDVGDASELVPGTYEGETMTVALNSRYLTDGFTAVGLGAATIEVLDPLKPAIIRGSADAGFLYLQMPVRL